MVRFLLPRPTSHVQFFHLYLFGENITKLNVGKKNQLVNEKNTTSSLVNNFKVPFFLFSETNGKTSTPWCSTAAAVFRSKKFQ